MPPNVLFVITHDMSARFGCYGDPHAQTPRLDALAAQPGAVRFDQHHCNYPLCGPSRASLFSGLRPRHTRRFNNQPFWDTLRDDRPAGYATLGEAFKRSGYRSECVWHALHAYETDPPSWSGPAWFPPNPPAPDGLETLGAEELRYWQNDASFGLIRKRLASAQARGIPADRLHRYARGPAVEAADVPDNAYTDGRATDHAVDLIAELAGDDAPFFLAVGYEAGHLPWTAPKRDFDAFDPNQFAVPRPAEPPAGTPACALNDHELAQYYTDTDYDQPWHANADQTREMLHGFYASLRYLDRQIGRLLDALDHAGAADDTIVVITSDHGFHLGEHGYFGKHCFWDQSTRCPLLIRRPAGTRPDAMPDGPPAVDAITEHVDLLPTLCDLAGIERPVGIDGASMLAGPSGPWRHDDPAHADTVAYRRRLPGDSRCQYFDAVSLRTRDHRLTIYRDADGTERAAELFDYASPERENVNRAGDPAVADRERDLRARIAPHLAALTP